MRIVGGQHKGRTLKAPRGLATRPMIARVREAVFNILGDRVEGARVADLFAGTGSIGLEALSRGAASVDAFESGRAALRFLRDNVAALGVGDRHRVHRAPLPEGLGAGPAWDLVFIDPPWGQGVGSLAAEAVVRRGRLAADGRIVLEERRGLEGDDVFWAARGLDRVDHRRYGDSAVVFLALPT